MFNQEHSPAELVEVRIWDSEGEGYRFFVPPTVLDGAVKWLAYQSRSNDDDQRR